MKIQPRQIASFLKNPDAAIRAVLVYGPEESLVRERATHLGKSVVPDLTDPFSVSMLQGERLSEDPAKLEEEARAIPMFGGRRLLRIESVGDKNTVAIKEYLSAPNDAAFLVLEAGALGPKSTLRKLFESAENAAALPCYVEDEKNAAQFIRAAFEEKGLTIDNDATAFLAQALVGDRGRLRSEIEKIALFKGSERSAIGLADVQACCGDQAAQTFDDLCYALGARDPQKSLRALDRLQDEGVAPVALIRVLSGHFRRLHFAATHVAAGQSLDTVVNGFQPRIFFKYEEAFRVQAQRWPIESLDRVLLRLTEIEARSKTSGAPVWALMGRLILDIAAPDRASAQRTARIAHRA